MRWVGMREGTSHIILWQLVRCMIIMLEEMDTDRHAAVSGASATIASDALMNPFDGAIIIRTFHIPS